MNHRSNATANRNLIEIGFALKDILYVGYAYSAAEKVRISNLQPRKESTSGGFY